jgi:hypothetical protein
VYEIEDDEPWYERAGPSVDLRRPSSDLRDNATSHIRSSHNWALHIGIRKLIYDGVEALTSKSSKAAVSEAAVSRLVRLSKGFQARAHGDGRCFWDLICIWGGRPAWEKHVPAWCLFRPMIVVLMHDIRTFSENYMFARASRYAPHISENQDVRDQKQSGKAHGHVPLF